MKVSDSPEFLESIANHPSVFPYVSCKGTERIEFGDVWEDCIGLEFDTGGWLMIRRDPGVFEVHTLFLPKSVDVAQKAKQVAEYMFDGIADELFTFVPVDLPHAKRLALKMGFKFTNRVAQGWERESGAVDVDCFWMTKHDYMERIECQSQAQ